MYKVRAAICGIGVQTARLCHKYAAAPPAIGLADTRSDRDGLYQELFFEKWEAHFFTLFQITLSGHSREGTHAIDV